MPSSPKILVVEDEAILRNEVVQTLHFEGYETYSAADGQDALEIARRVFPDLIISDVMMPNLDGYGLLLALREDDATAHIPFIFLTAKAGYGDLRRGMAYGADDYLVKPFDIRDLLAAIQARLEKQAKTTRKYQQQVNTIRNSVVTALPHELRTPLTSIMGYVDLMLTDLDTLKPDQLLRMLLRIQQSSNRLYRLIQNYTLFTQLEIIGLNPEKLAFLAKYRDVDPSDPAEVVPRVAAERSSAYNRQSDIVLSVEAARVRILGEDFSKIVEEIVDNALKFSPQQSQIEISGQVASPLYQLVIADKGRGMTAEQRGSIAGMVQFERDIYEQQGSGLGLTIAKRLVDIYKGQLIVDSEPGQGTQVSLLFEMAPPEKDTA